MKLILAAIFLSSSTTFAAAYKLDASHSIVGFGVKHLMFSTTKGRFNKFEGAFDFDEKKSEVTKIDVKVDVASIDTNDVKRNDHLKSPDFFDVAKNADIKFTADKVKVEKNKAVKVAGQLTMKGITKPVTLDLTYSGTATDPWGNERVGFNLSGKINRKDWGINWNKNLDGGGVVVGEEVSLEIEGEAVKSK